MASLVFSSNEKDIPKMFIKLALPVVVSMVITLLYNMADTYFIAATGNTNLIAGVSLCAPIFTLLMSIGNIFGQGGSSLMSRLLGQNNNTAARKVSAFCFYIALLSGIVIGLLMLVFKQQAASFLGGDNDTMPHLSIYYCILALGAPIIILSFIHTNLMRSEGLAKESMIATVSGVILNIILDPIFILTLGMGAKGAAIATVLGYTLTDGYCIFIVICHSKILSIAPIDSRIPGSAIKDIFGVGIPAALTNIMASLSIIFTNLFLLSYGNDCIAAMGIALKINTIVGFFIVGMAFGTQPLFGYYYGAKNKDCLHALLRFASKVIGIVSVVLTIIVFIGADPLMRFFVSNPSVVNPGIPMIQWQVITMPMVAFILLTTIILQSFGKATMALLVSISRQGAVFIVVLLIANLLIGYNGILMTQAIANFITLLFCLYLYKYKLSMYFQRKNPE